MNLALAIGLFVIALLYARGALKIVQEVAARKVPVPDPAGFAWGVVLVAAEVVVLVLAGMRLM